MPTAVALGAKRRGIPFTEDRPVLVFTRTEDQKTRLTVPPSSEPTVIEVMPIRIRGGRNASVRLGFEAPKAVVIVRDDCKSTDGGPTL